MTTKIRAEDIATLKKSGLFDAEWYCASYPDVTLSGMDPAEHFLWIGAKLGRSPVPPGSLAKTIGRALSNKSAQSETAEPAWRDLDALFIDGTNGTSSTPYRVFRIANGLRTEGLKVRCAKGEDLFSLVNEDVRARLVVFHRAPYWSPYVEFVRKMRANGAIIVFDVDDLVFDESVVPQIDGYRYLSEKSKEGFLKGLRAYREFILNADLCTSPTSFLVDTILELGKPAFLVRNAISEDNIKFFDNINYRRKGRPTPFVVGYYSGTKTHQADFAVAAPALVQFMRDNPEVIFRLAGEFDLHDYPDLVEWQHISRPGDVPRVTRVGLMPHDAMIRDQLSCDLIIAPLEVDNPFCEAKSELKFFEASLAQCPVIASSTRTFREATNNGALASLATTTLDWLAAFREVHGDYSASLKRAQQAFFHVRASYSQSFATAQAIEAYNQFSTQNRGGNIVAEPAYRPVSGVADVGVILPDFTGPSGGHRKVFTVCKELERAGLTVKLYFYTSRLPKVIRRDIRRMFCELDAEVVSYFQAVDNHETVICTQWKTAYDFRNVEFAGRILNFVQDFEPMFYPVGSDYLRALASYHLNYETICYGKWVAAKLKDEVGLESKVIPFTLDHATYSAPKTERSRDIDILLFARPSQDRRCFEIIMEGLIDLKRRRPAVRIGLFGEDEYENIDIEYDNFGSITDLSQLADLYRRAKVGICYSPTNPSQLGYEMVACGVGLIDVRIKFSELNFEADSIVQYCDGTPEDMSRVCEEMLSDPRALAKRRKKGYAFVRGMPADDQLGVEFMRAAGLAQVPVETE